MVTPTIYSQYPWTYPGGTGRYACMYIFKSLLKAGTSTGTPSPYPHHRTINQSINKTDSIYYFSLFVLIFSSTTITFLDPSLLVATAQTGNWAERYPRQALCKF